VLTLPNNAAFAPIAGIAPSSPPPHTGLQWQCRGQQGRQGCKKGVSFSLDIPFPFKERIMLQNWAYRLFVLATFFTVSIDGAFLLGAEKPAAEAAPTQTPGGPGKPSAEAAIRQALTKRVELKYDNLPLGKVAQDLQAKLGVPVRLDSKALVDMGFNDDTPVTFAISNVSARAAILLMLRQLGLDSPGEKRISRSPREKRSHQPVQSITFITAHEVLLITSAEEAENMLRTRVYDVSDLVCYGDGSADDQPDFDTLIDLITCCVRPMTWDAVGGPGSIAPFEAAGIRAVVVDQTEDVFLQLDELLEQLRSMRDPRGAGRKASSEQASKRQEAAPPQLITKDGQIGPKISAAEKAVRQALEKPLNVHFQATPLSDAIKQLGKTAAVPIVLDRKALSDVGVDPSAPVTLDASGRTMSSVLDELVRAPDLAWTYSGESLLVTTGEQEESLSITRTYDVADLPAYRNQRGEGIPDYQAIIDRITKAIKPATWDTVGGPGSIGPFDNAGVHGIVVFQVWKTHLEIEALLAKLRQLRGRALTADDIKKLPSEPEPPELGVAGQPPKPLEAEPRRDAFVAANNQLAFDLHKQLRGENLFFSPSSAAMAMAMVYTGARGKTAEEMAKALRFTMPQEEVPPAVQSLLATLPGANHSGCKLTVANRLWGQQGYGFLEPFVTITRERFGAGLTEVDFTNPVPVCRLINDWADKNTSGKIKQIVGPDTITPRLRFILTNAVYFKGQWAEPFEKDATKTAPFFVRDEQIDVSLMHKLTRCRYGAIDNVKVLEKSYRGGEIAMMILLPNKEFRALSDLEQSLSAEKVKEWSSKLKVQMVDIYLPKFKLETDIPLTDALTSLGMARVFDPRQADLSGINGGKEPLWLDWVLQRAYVNVDEEGTEAAAVTAMGMGGGMPPPRIAVFRADHPFVFLIRDTRTGCILFLGRLVKPEKTAPTDSPGPQGFF
jgi:serpin B